MPTKRQFDMAVAVVILTSVFIGGVVKPWALRKRAEGTTSGFTNDFAGFVILA